MVINERAEKIAERIFEKLGRTVPVNPIRICERYGIVVYKSKLNEGLDGGLIKDGESIKIYVDTNAPLNRMRFTISHELGHYFMHVDPTKDFTVRDFRNELSSTGKSQYEIEANSFAAALLMNRDETVKMYKEYGSIPLLANYFGVSVEAMKYRIDNLGLGDCDNG